MAWIRVEVVCRDSCVAGIAARYVSVATGLTKFSKASAAAEVLGTRYGPGFAARDVAD